MLTIVCILISLAIFGVIAFFGNRAKVRDFYGKLRSITLHEFIAGAIVIGIAAFLATVVVGPGLARESAIGGYHEFWNGSVTEPVVQVDECHRDGSCEHTYRCDHEEVWHTTYNSKGEASGGYWEDIYHQCPYATRELKYVLETNIGKSFTIADGYFEAHPEEWRSGEGLPSVSEVPREPPERWIKAKTDLENGLSDPVTKVAEYENFILASDSELYTEYEGGIEEYQKAGLLPKTTAHLDEDNMLFDYDMQAQKVQAVGGLKLANIGEWQNRLMRLNAALGVDFQGDIHIVLVPADKISNPDEYITALKAYWTSLGKWSISKNGIILAIGVSPDGKTVEWSRAETGMPVGNEQMLAALKFDLSGESFDPDVLLGNVSASIHKKGSESEIVYDKAGGGLVGNIVFTKFPFARACMKCEDEGDNGAGYVDLRDQVPITTGAKIEMIIVVAVITLVLGALFYFLDPFGKLFGSSDEEEKTNRYTY